MFIFDLTPLIYGCYLSHQMKKIFLLFYSSLVLFSLEACKPLDPPPNVILILTDDQGWGDLSLNGNVDITTPNIDRLGTMGIRFDRFYVSPVCSPTRAELLTGRHHVRGGVYGTSAGGERLDEDEQTLAEVLKTVGYQTAAYGKWHNGMQAPYHPNSRGFDDFYGFCSGHWGNYYNPVLEHNGTLVRGDGFIIDDLTQRGIDFINKNKNKPFFLYLPYNTPHSPMQVPDRFWEKFKNKELRQEGHRGPYKTQEEIDHARAALAMCENIDWNVGRIIEQLEKNNLIENTIVIYLSDNGPNGFRWNGEMKGIKGSTDEGGVRSPMMMQWLGKFPQGKVIKEIASGIDLLPTLVDIIGIDHKAKNTLDGKSLKPLITEENPSWKDRYIFNYWRGKLSVRNQNYRLDNTNQLFDMKVDPHQTNDISVEKQQILAQLKQQKIQWEKEVLSELPLKDERPFYIGHPSLQTTQIPARDGTATGSIKRSNRYPNCSYFTHWVNVNDSLVWNIAVPHSGDFEVTVYYSCAQDALGSVFELGFGKSKIKGQITEVHDREEYGAAEDRVTRKESYVKDFKPLNLGVMHLEAGKGLLTLKGIKKTGEALMDFRLLLFKRLSMEDRDRIN